MTPGRFAQLWYAAKRCLDNGQLAATFPAQRWRSPSRKLGPAVRWSTAVDRLFGRATELDCVSAEQGMVFDHGRVPCGGLALVQDPHTIEYSGMPTSAIEATGVDGCIPAAGLAEALIGLVHRALPTTMPEVPKLVETMVLEQKRRSNPRYGSRCEPRKRHYASAALARSSTGAVAPEDRAADASEHRGRGEQGCGAPEGPTWLSETGRVRAANWSNGQAVSAINPVQIVQQITVGSRQFEEFSD